MTENTVAVSVISHYRLIAKLGAGGMGEVYKAHDETLDRPVALKVLPPHLLQDVDRVRRFVQEARSASALNHPNIVTIYEIGQVPVEAEPSTLVHYIAMEYIDGITLRKMMQQGASIPSLLEILAQSADGLAKAHNAGIVHRDLKPDNIMITSDGFAKVVDFGLAKLTESRGNEDTSKTDEGMVMGTVGYMAPEQIDGSVIDQRADIFAFGCILYEACTGRRPFDAPAAIDTMNQIVFSEPTRPTELRAEITPSLELIILRCLAKRPDQRYQSIREVASEIRSITRGRSMPAMDAPPPASSPRPASGPSVASGALAAGVSAPPLRSRAAEPVRKRTIAWGTIVYRVVLLSVVALIGYLWWSFPSLDQLGQPNATTPVMDREKANGARVEYHWVDESDIPQSLRKMVVASEDPQFFDRERVTLASVQNAIRQSIGKRQFQVPLRVSPLSRELADEALVGGSSSPIASMQASVAAYSIEGKLSRKQILETYLNVAKFGDGVFGIEAAANRYFKKPAEKLTSREAALIIATRKDPLHSNPAKPDDTLTAESRRLMALIR